MEAITPHTRKAHKNMTKKHFIKLADSIRDFGIAGGHRDHSNAFGQDQISALASFCQSVNPRFNRERWIAYIAGECGPSGGKVKHTQNTLPD